VSPVAVAASDVPRVLLTRHPRRCVPGNGPPRARPTAPLRRAVRSPSTSPCRTPRRSLCCTSPTPSLQNP